MSVDLEQRVRDSLNRQAVAVSTPLQPDPWAKFSVLERRHRTRRRARRAVLGAGCVGLVAAVGAGVIPLPDLVPAVSLSPSSSYSVLNGWPTRGSLAGDLAWQAGLRRQLVGSDEDEGHWKVVDRDQTKVIFAGDVPGARVALVSVTLRLGLIKDRILQWYTGPAGATPQAMSMSGSDASPVVATTMDGDDKKPGYLLVVAPPGAMVKTTLGVEFGADGRLKRDWTQAPSSDGTAIVAVPAAQRMPSAAVQVTLGGRTIFDAAPVDQGWSSEGDPAEVSRAAVSKALNVARGATGGTGGRSAGSGSAGSADGSSGSAAELDFAVWVVQQALDGAGLAPDEAALRIPWIGKVHGQAAIVVELTPPGGGTLAFAFHGDPSSSRQDLRLLMPARGAFTRPLAWRLRAEGSDEKTADLAVTTSPGTRRAQLVVGDVTTTLPLDADGFALTQLPPDTAASIQAYDAKDQLIGETVVPPLENSGDGVPGARRATRLVD